MSKMNITYGNREGRWFTQWRFDDLETLARDIERRMGVTEFNVWYDEREDFHHLGFELNGVKVDIRYYKVLSVSYDGVDAWIGCPWRYFGEFLHAIKERLCNTTAETITQPLENH